MRMAITMLGKPMHGKLRHPAGSSEVVANQIYPSKKVPRNGGAFRKPQQQPPRRRNLMTMMPSQVLPDAFPNTKRTEILSYVPKIPGGLDSTRLHEINTEGFNYKPKTGSTLMGKYVGNLRTKYSDAAEGLKFFSDARHDRKNPFITLNPEGGRNEGTYIHELGHAIWSNDTTPENRLEWYKVHADLKDVPMSDKYLTPRFHNTLGRYLSGPNSGDNKLSDPRALQTFAESMSLYATDPEYLKDVAPKMYEYFQKLSGFEYSRKKPKTLQGVGN
jgi:hypothetical protein